MIDIEERVRALDQSTSVPQASIETIMRRARRLRLRRRGAVVVAIAAIVAGGLVASSLRPSSTKQQVIVAPSTTTPTRSTTVAPPVAVPPPSFLIAHQATYSGQAAPGRIVVIDTTTRKVVRVLGTAPDTYLSGGGFALARDPRLALWLRLDASTQTLELVGESTAGGPQRIFGSRNFDHQPQGGGLLGSMSADGTELLLNGLYAADLVTGVRQPVAPAPIPAGWGWDWDSWLPNGHEILVLETRSAPNRCGVIVRRTPCQVASASRALVYDLHDPQAGWRVVPAADRTGGWSDLQLLGPGRLPSTVVALDPVQPFLRRGAEVMTIDTTSGAIVDRVTPPPGNVLAVDASGTNFLLAGSDGHLERFSLADPRPVIIGAPYGEAAW